MILKYLYLNIMLEEMKIWNAFKRGFFPLQFFCRLNFLTANPFRVLYVGSKKRAIVIVLYWSAYNKFFSVTQHKKSFLLFLTWSHLHSLIKGIWLLLLPVWWEAETHSALAVGYRMVSLWCSWLFLHSSPGLCL